MRRLPIAIVLGSALLGLLSAARAQDQGKRADPKAVFAETDTNGDGQIDLEEFHARLVDIYFIADPNKDGFLSAEEFNRLAFSEDFAVADKNGDGRVTLAEFVTIRFLQFQAADTNGDSQVSLEELVTVYEGRKKQ